MTRGLAPGLQLALEWAASDFTQSSSRQSVPIGLNADSVETLETFLAFSVRCEEQRQGVLCADAMGIGKTVQALALMLARPSPLDWQGGDTLVVLPTSLLEKWKFELHYRVGTDWEPLEYLGNSRPSQAQVQGRVVLTTYGQLRSLTETSGCSIFQSCMGILSSRAVAFFAGETQKSRYFDQNP